MRAQPGEQRADRVAVAHHHPVHAAHLAVLRGDAQPARGADQGERRLLSGAVDLQRGAAAGLGEQPWARNAPRQTASRRIAGRSPATGAGRDRAPPAVDQAGLPGHRLASGGHPQQVAVPRRRPPGDG